MRYYGIDGAKNLEQNNCLLLLCMSRFDFFRFIKDIAIKKKNVI